MSNIDFSQIVSLSDFAKENKVVAASLAKWIEADGIKPVLKLGNTNGYNRDDLKKAVGNHSNSATVLRAVGYVHPDQHKAVEDHRDRLARITAEQTAQIADLESQLTELLAKHDSVTADLNKLAALEAAGVDNWSGYDRAMAILDGKSDEFGDEDEYDNTNLPE